MDKILGEPFDDYVSDQIKVRQNSLAKHQKDVADLQVFNSSTPWIRLTSSIIIDAQRTKELVNNLDLSGDKIEGRNLAKNLVLFAGASKGDDLKNRRGGVGYGIDNAYGFLSDKEQGYKPMPGITGISTTYKNNGSLKQAQVSITCFTRKQFEALEVLYLRLGFTAILEWGHSIYFDNNGVKQNMNAMTIPNLMFTGPVYKNPSVVAKKAAEEALRKNPNLKWYEKDEVYFDTKRKQEQLNKNNGANPTRIRTSLIETKKATGGNYDGMLAKVSNFSWNLNSDLSYSIILDLISVGDIVDSIKMNIGSTGNQGGTGTERVDVKVGLGVRNLATIALEKGTSKLNKFLYELTEELADAVPKEEYSEATQELLEFKNAALALVPFIPELKERYQTALLTLIEKNVNTFNTVRDMLKEGVYQVTSLDDFGRPRTATFDFTKSNFTEAEFTSFLAELEYTDAERGLLQKQLNYVKFDKTTGTYKFSVNFSHANFLEEFDLTIKPNPNGNTPKYIVVDRPANAATLGAFRGPKVQILDKALKRIQEYFNGLQPIKIGDPDKDNLNEIEYLIDKQGNPKKVILDMLTERSWYNYTKTYKHPSFEVIDEVVDIIVN